MSASREKKLRQELAASGTPDPKKVREAEEKAKQHRSNVLYGCIAAVFVLVAAFLLIWNSNVIQRSSTAVTIDGQKYSAAQVDYFYHVAYNQLRNSQYASYMGLGDVVDLSNTNLNDMAKTFLGVEEDMTWDAYLKDSAIKNLTQITALNNAAKEAGFSFNDEMQADVNATLDQIKETASSNGMSVGSYLKAAFGSNMTTATLKDILKATTLASHYDENYRNSLTYDDDKLEDAYAADSKQYDVVAYESIYFNGTAPSTTGADGKSVAPTEEESAAAKAAAKEAADEALKRYENGESLESIAQSMDNANYSNQEAAAYSSSVVGDWAFDEARQSGDHALLESDPNCYLVVFHDRGRNEYNTVDARHILFLTDTSKLDSNSESYDKELALVKDAAKAKAEDALQQWKDGEATEESFAALAEELSEDGGSKSNGGLYQEIYHNQMVQTFNDWIFDESRQVGDTGIVETDYGYHVMYFSGENIPYWKVQVRNSLRNTDYNAWLEALTADLTATEGSGMKYVG